MDLTEKLLEINHVELLVEQLSTIFQEAIIIENKHFELIAYNSPNESSFDPVQQKTILTKRCPLFIIERLKKEGIIEKINRKNKPIRLQAIEDIGFYQRVVISLKHEGRLHGYLWIYESQEISDLSVLSEIAPHLGRLLHERQRVTENDQQSVIWKLLNHEYGNQAEIYREANIASYTLPKEFTVFIASIKDPAYLSVLNKIKQVLIDMDIAFYLGKGTEIIGIVHGENNKTSQCKTKEIVKAVKQTVNHGEQSVLIIGSGNNYEQIQDMRQSYLEALEVIETMVFLNLDEQPTYYFNHLDMYRYIKVMYKKNMSEQYRNRNIIQLMQKDVDNKSELLKTLWFFLKNDCKVGQTAEKLFIHPNTLHYRVKQIVELTAIDFSNVNEKMELYSLLLILHHVPDFQVFYAKVLESFPSYKWESK